MSSLGSCKPLREEIGETSDDVSPEVTVTVADIHDQNEFAEPPNAAVLVEGVVMVEEANIEAENRGENDRENEMPPGDDICSICFGPFRVPCRADCGHWYCGNCILQFWNYAPISGPCKCPMCARDITNLSPEASLQQRQEQEVKEVLAKVRRYNRLFVGGLVGFVQKVHELPLLMRRMMWHMMDPDVNILNHNEVSIYAMSRKTLDLAAKYNIIPRGVYGIATLFCRVAIATIVILRLVGRYRRHRLAQRVRNLAAAEMEPLNENQREL